MSYYDGTAEEKIASNETTTKSTTAAANLLHVFTL